MTRALALVSADAHVADLEQLRVELGLADAGHNAWIDAPAAHRRALLRALER